MQPSHTLDIVEVNLLILGIRNNNEDVLLLVIPITTYSKMVLVVVGSKIIDKALSLMTAGELAKSTMTWRQAHFGVVMLGLLQLSCSSSDRREIGGGSKMLLSKEWPCRVVEVPTGQCQRSSSHCTDGHYSAIWHHQYVGQYQCQGTLHAGSCPHRTGAQSPVASSIGTYSYFLGTTSWFLKGTSLPAQLEFLCCINTHKSCGWTGYSCQPSTTSGPPNQDCWRDKQPCIKRMGLGGSRPPKSHWVAWVRAETG